MNRVIRLRGYIGGALCGVLLAAGSAWASPCPPQVRLAFSDTAVAPFMLGDGEAFTRPPGIMVDWVRRALAGMRCKGVVRMSRLPTSRLSYEIESGDQDILIGYAPTPERMGLLAYPMYDGQPDPELFFGQSVLSFFTRGTEKDVTWDGRTLTARNPTVGVVRGQLPEIVARGHGWPVEATTTVPLNVAKLRAGRFDVILQSDIDVRGIADAGRGLRKLAPPVADIKYYAPVAKKFFTAYPEFSKRILAPFVPGRTDLFHDFAGLPPLTVRFPELEH